MRRFLLVAPLFFILAACGSGGLSGPGLYIALGDSLSEGVGASDPSATFVSLVHEGLGEGVDLMNLGHSGDTSSDLLDHGHLEQAVAEVGQRNGDDDPNNDVRLVTLEIGGNDLLRLYPSLVLTGTCALLRRALDRPQCVDALRDALDEFGQNLATALDRLQEADPEGLNDIVRGEAAERGLRLVDWHPLFEGKANEYIASDFIHPNDVGHEVMAEAILEAVR